MASNVHIHFEDVPIESSIQENAVNNWLQQVSKNEGFQIENINLIFCSDEYLLNINKVYLNHDYYTDVITFDHSEIDHTLEGDIFISLDRVMENSTQFGANINEEIHRVIVHGQLHLMGYQDKTDKDKKVMTDKENAYLSLLSN